MESVAYRTLHTVKASWPQLAGVSSAGCSLSTNYNVHTSSCKLWHFPSLWGLQCNAGVREGQLSGEIPRVLLCLHLYLGCARQYTRYNVLDGLLGYTGFYWVLLGFTGFYWVLLGFTGFYWVLLGFTEFYWVLLVHEAVCWCASRQAG